MIKKVTTHSEEEWLALRHQYIGGSDCAALISMNPFSSPFAVWAEKTDMVEPFKGNLATELGTFLEPFIAKKWSDETGKKVRNIRQSILNDKYPWAIANIDRDVVGESAGLELKSCSELRMKEFHGGEYPANYYAQCVHYLAVTGYQKWYLGVLVGNRHFLTFEIERDEDEIASLMKAEEEFWNKYVVPKVAPPVDGSYATTDAINEIFSMEGGGLIDLSRYEGTLQQRKNVDAHIKSLREEKDRLENQIKMLMGDNEKATCGSFTISWKTQKTSGLDREAIRRDYPDINFSKYATESRVFRITEKKSKKED
nr:YqaJ viral recombinase family protein [Clostridia bacterium]